VDLHDWTRLVDRFESGRSDWYPVDPNDRALTADVCRYIAQQVEAQNYKSFQDYLRQASTLPAEAGTIPAQELLTYLQRWLPQQEEFQRIAEEGLMRLGHILPNGSVDLDEFHARFERLARGTAADALHRPAGAGVDLFDDDSDKRLCSHGPQCPLDLSAIPLQRLTNIASALATKGEDGRIALDKLHMIVEANDVKVSRRIVERLKRWLGEPQEGLYYWPPLLAFTISIDRISIIADKPTRTAYPCLRLEVSFCGRTVKFPPFQWTLSMMGFSEPKKMTRTQQCNAMFNIDGPHGINREDLLMALRPQVPPSHAINISLIGLPREATDKSSFTYTLGSVDLLMDRDIPPGDLHLGRRGTEKKIDWHLPVAGSSKGPKLHADINISTRHAGRVHALRNTRR
jgi:hypothetical protein